MTHDQHEPTDPRSDSSEATLSRSTDETFERSPRPARRRAIAAALLLLVLAATGGLLAAWKSQSLAAQDAAAASQPEPAEAITAAVATPREHRATVTSIGTVLALRSVTLRNELPGTVREVLLEPGTVVGAGEVLVRLDVSVEQAELAALRAQAELARALLERYQQASRTRAVAAHEVDRARAELDVALAQIARTEAIVERKTVRAPFRARVGLADLHRGQYLDEGTVLTTLQGVDDAAHVDFAVAQRVAAGLAPGDVVRVHAPAGGEPLAATIVAVDSLIDPTTRNASVRARLEGLPAGLSPGASARVEVPDGPARTALAVPVSALRKGPEGDHVFVLAEGEDGRTRAHLRPVRAGAVLGGEVLILDGLAEGEPVAASGSFKLREAALVAVAGEAAARADAGEKGVG